ncbi:MAG TPA: glycosyltransferase [Flavisolibacter sp.]|nr:glycosyltransferase [Flavisolibacter sp.]
MNILMLYTHNPVATSGIIPVDLMKGFQKKGHKVKLVVNSYDPDYPADLVSMETRFLFKKKNFIQRVTNKLRLKKPVATDPKYHFFDLDEKKKYYRTQSILGKAQLKPDVIILFFVKGFINSQNIHELHRQTNAPVFWLMYDMAPLTGGCHYAWECKGYQNQCGNCPGLHSTDPHDISFWNLQYKKEYLDKTNLHIVTASEWQYRQAKASTLFKNHPVHKILTGFSEHIFKPVPKEDVRKKYGIGAGKKVIFFGAFYMSDERKGMQYLLEALRMLKEVLANRELQDNVLLLIAGKGLDAIKDALPFAYHNLGMLDNTYGIASAYQAADVFVCPSVEDSGPTMINQSMMCGTPVVSFEMGVAPDLVFSGKTGYKARLKDSKDLAHGINHVLSVSQDDYERMSANCRKLAMELFQPDVNINNWLKILNYTTK